MYRKLVNVCNFKGMSNHRIKPNLVSSCTKRYYGLFVVTSKLTQMNFGSRQPRQKPKSFQERQDSRFRKPKGERKQKENQLEEAKQFVDVDFPDILDSISQAALKRCDDMLLSLCNTPTMLEKFKIEVGGKERPLIQLGSFTRPSKRQVLFKPTIPNLANQIVVKLSKFDHRVLTQRNPDGSILINIPQITTQRREDIVYEMKLIEGSTLPRIHERRKHAIKQMEETAPNLEYNNKMTLTSEIDEKIKAAETRLKTDMEEKIYDARNAKTEMDLGDENEDSS